MNKNILKDIAIVLLCVVVFGGVSFVITRMAFSSATESFMNAARSYQAVATVTLICVGGVFAYRRLQLFRTFEPHLTISHNIRHRHIGDNYTHIDVTAALHNSSKVQVELREGYVLLQKISPESDENIEERYAQVFIDKEKKDIQWTTLERIDRSWSRGELIVEPGEAHPETYEFIVSRDVKSVLIYTYFYDQRFSQDTSSPRGWVATTIYDILNNNRTGVSQ